MCILSNLNNFSLLRRRLFRHEEGGRAQLFVPLVLHFQSFIICLRFKFEVNDKTKTTTASPFSGFFVKYILFLFIRVFSRVVHSIFELKLLIFLLIFL